MKQHTAVVRRYDVFVPDRADPTCMLRHCYDVFATNVDLAVLEAVKYWSETDFELEQGMTFVVVEY